jgi:hypothetical protein
MSRDLPIQALNEEIGMPELFTGRTADLAFFMDWVAGAKRQLSQSHVILARKRRGKTALVQRLFNLIYTQNDPKIIPFYIRIDEGRMTQLGFSVRLFCSLLSQYLGFKRRDPRLIRNPLSLTKLKDTLEDEDLLSMVEDMEVYVEKEQLTPAWELAREAGHIISSLKDERIIQIIDEFQFLNDRIYLDKAHKHLIELGSFYQRTGSSRISPQIITGSYIGWLSQIVGSMVGRYYRYYLEPLTHEEAIAAIYNYSSVLGREVSDESAAYMAEACYRDPYYIAQTFDSKCVHRDLTSKHAIREILQYETGTRGEITGMWMDYLLHAFARINDKNAKKIVLYLAYHQERNRKQIMEDLKLQMSDGELEKKLHKLVKADIIEGGSSNYFFKGLGDPIFAMVFRKVYQSEIDETHTSEIEDDLNQRLKSLKGKVAHYKGIMAEYRLINRLLFLGLSQTPPENVFTGVRTGYKFGPFSSLSKHSFHLEQEKRIEVDIYGTAEHIEDSDLVVEVKDHANPPNKTHVDAFIETKTLLDQRCERPTAFLFYSETGLSEALQTRLNQAGIMFSDGTRLFSRPAPKQDD